jgi:tetratricopeptide (TPR) repeat protein
MSLLFEVQKFDMARRKRNQKKADETLVDLVEARESAQSFYETNQNLIFGILIAVVVGIGGFLAYQNFVVKPKEEKAVAQMWKAENQFARDSFAMALTNPGGGFDGLKTIVDEYGNTDPGNAANYYAGVSYLHLGQFEAAISYLKDVKADGDIMPIMKNGTLGDAYSETGDLDKALSYYKKAVKAAENNEALAPVYLIRYGMLSEKLEKYDEARTAYETLLKKYSTSTLTREAEKFLIRLEDK